MRTEDLIDRLARDADRVRPLPAPGRRAGVWFAVSAAFVTIVVLVMSPRPDLAEALRSSRFWVEQLAALLTAVLAAHAALALSIPGTSRRIAITPLGPAAVWIGSQGVGCFVDVAARTGWDISAEPECLALIALTGSLPLFLLLPMVRLGVPVRPRLCVALVALAAAALGNVGLRVFHAQDAALMILVWQTGSVALLTLVGWFFGPKILPGSPTRRKRRLGALPS